MEEEAGKKETSPKPHETTSLRAMDPFEIEGKGVSRTGSEVIGETQTDRKESDKAKNHKRIQELIQVRESKVPRNN